MSIKLPLTYNFDRRFITYVIKNNVWHAFLASD